MDHKQLFNNSIEIQKKALHNALELNNLYWLYWDQAERISNYWMNSFNLSPGMHDLIEQWRSLTRKGREGSKEVMNSSYDNYKAYLEHLEKNEPKPKARAKTKQAT
jgi:hypothetical protein